MQTHVNMNFKAAGTRSMNFSKDELAAIGKKKLIPERYEPVTYRVIDMENNDLRQRRRPSPPFSNTNTLGQTVTAHRSQHHHRQNRPHPRTVGLLRCNAATMLEPVCDVRTDDTRFLQHRWWPDSLPAEWCPRAAHTLDTTAREDYQARGRCVRRLTRHGSNPHIRPTVGAVPITNLVTLDQPRLWKEGFSFEHAYDSRKEPSYPIRARRQGHLVWGELDPSEVDRLDRIHRTSMARSSGGPAFRYLSTDSSPPPPPPSEVAASRAAAPSGALPAHHNLPAAPLENPCTSLEGRAPCETRISQCDHIASEATVFPPPQLPPIVAL